MYLKYFSFYIFFITSFNWLQADNEIETIKNKITSENNYKLKVDAINYYLKISSIQTNTFDYNYYNQGLVLCHQYNYQPGLAELYLNYSSFFIDSLPFDSIKDKLEFSIVIFRNFALKTKQAEAKSVYGSLLLSQGKFAKAATELNEALLIFSEKKDTVNIINIYSKMAMLYLHLLMFNDAKTFVNAALELSSFINDKQVLYNLKYSYALLNFFKGNYTETLFILNQINILGSTQKQHETNIIIGICYAETGKTDSAFVYLNQGLKNKNALAYMAHLYLTYLYKNIKKTNESILHKNRVSALLPANNNSFIHIPLLNFIFKKDSETQKQFDAYYIDYTNRYFDFKKSIDFSIISDNYIKFKLQLENPVKSLQTLQESMKKRNYFFLFILLFVIFLFTATTISIYRKKIKIITEQQKQIELQNKMIEVKNIEVMQANENAEAAVNIKSQFISNINHEIRTPLNAIMGVANLLQSQNPSEHQLENINILKDSSAKLHEIVNNMLDFGKMMHGNMQFNHTPFNLKMLIKDIKDLFKLNAIEKGLNFKLEIDETIPEKLVGDPLRINQVIINLVSNAIKYTQQGTIMLLVKKEISTLSNVLIRFEVSDTGIGISQNDLTNIFNSFVLADADLNRKMAGVGLGLSISQKIIEALGSKINVQSKVGEGSTFSFSLNFEIAKPELSPREKELLEYNAVLKGNKVLIVEDNVMNILVLKQFLQSWGVHAEIAINGLDAIRRVKAEHFDLILMDIHMPEMDGIEATKHLKNSQDKRIENIPIIALTADANSKVKEKLMQAGMIDLVLKPFEPDDLKERMARVILMNKAQV